MQRVTIGGLSFALPFADPKEPLFRAHTVDELAALEKSIVQAGGVSKLCAVVTATVPELGGIVVDGATRATICARHKLPCEKTDAGEMSLKEAECWARVFNFARRHLSPGELERARRERITLVAGKRAEGKSIRAIADEVDIDPKQVRRDLEAAGGDTVPTSDEPTVVTGRDGKEYPASRPRAQPTDARKALTVARKCAKGLAKAVADVIADSVEGPRFREVAASWDVPVLEAGCWAVLLAVDGVLDEVAGEPAEVPVSADAAG